MYLDNAATTNIHPLVVKEMEKIGFANYNSLYYEEATTVKNMIDKYTNNIAIYLNVNVNSIVYTSGATESNNYIIKGIYELYPDKHFITSTIEHKCVIESFKYIQSKGASVTFISPNSDGVITSDIVKNHLRDDTIFVSIMYVNNETGVINEISEISKLLKNKNILFHSDIAQAFGKIKIDFSLFDYASLSAHKFNGPKGIGLAIINNVSPISLLSGSSQQNNHRSGTLPNFLIAGMYQAIELSYKNFDENILVLKNNREHVLKFLCKHLGDDFEINFVNSIDSIISIRIKNQFNQLFLKNNSDIIKASTGSSCSINEPSYVLLECGLSKEVIRETIRLSFSMYDKLY